MGQMKIAVTGASGQLGGAIVRALAKVGQANEVEVIGVARTPERAEDLGVEIRRGDYNDANGLVHAFHDVDTVLLVAGKDEPKTRIQQHRNVIDAASEADVARVVYAGILVSEGAPKSGPGFASIQQCSLETEQYLAQSGMGWSVGRCGIYIEPDLEYVDEYAKQGVIRNSAGDSTCSYTSRDELAKAYASLLTQPSLDGRSYNLVGEPITQAQLAELINAAFGTSLRYEPVSVEDYRTERVAALGPFLGGVIASIYEGIHRGGMSPESHYEQVTGVPHVSAKALVDAFQNS